MFDSPSNWTTSTLEELSSSITSGGTPTSGDKRYYLEAGGHPFAKTEDLSRSNSKYLSECDLNVSDLALKNSAAKLYPKGTVLVSMYGTIGLSKITDVELAANQALCALIPPFKCNADFLYHMLCFIRPDWLKDSGQTTQANISGGAVKKRVIYVPSAGEQETIANILDTLDTQIRQTEAIIAKLQQVKQGLLHDLLTRGIDANGQLRPPRDQAPELYKESPLGWVPKEWEVANLGKFADLMVGYAFKSQWFEEKGVKLLRGENVGYGLADWSDMRCLSPAKAEEYQGYFLKRNDIVIGMDRTFTKTGIKITVLGKSDCPSLLVQRVGKFVPSLIEQPFLRWLVVSPSYIRHLMSQQKGMDIPHLSKSEILNPFVPMPSSQEQMKIAAIMDSVEKKIDAEWQACKKLKKQKSGLMDDLLTGRVRVTSLLDTAKAS